MICAFAGKKLKPARTFRGFIHLARWRFACRIKSASGANSSSSVSCRARQETLLLELAPLADLIRHAKRHLAKWMKPRKVRAGFNFFPAKAQIIYQPLGVVGIIGAWNYPVFLAL